MDTIVIAGGNSGIGLQAARELLAAGHRVILLGRERKTGEGAIAAFGAARDRAVFLSVDLSTHAGVRDAARRVDDLTDRINGLIHSAAVFSTNGAKTTDGLNLFFALSYLSRYHLTQRLLPKLLLADQPRVVMLTATLNEVPRLDPMMFPDFEDRSFWSMIYPVNGACLYYADYLTRTHPRVFAGCVSPGFVRTGIFREAPWFMKLFVALAAPFRAISVQAGAHNAVQAILHGEGGSALCWNKPGDFQQSYVIRVDRPAQDAVIEISRRLTGV